MRVFLSRTLCGLVSAFAATVALGSGTAQAQLIINELYANGGSSTAPRAFQRDFIELYNNTATSIDLSGYSLQYASATGNFNGGTNLFALTGSIAANDYFLITVGGAGTAGAVNPPANADTTGLGLGAAGGKLALVFGTTALGTITANSDISTGDTVNGQLIVDFVGYGTANAREGSLGTLSNAPAPTLGTSSIERSAFADTDDNETDFSELLTPTPQAAASVVVPEASSVALLAFGFSGLVGLVVRRRTAK